MQSPRLRACPAPAPQWRAADWSTLWRFAAQAGVTFFGAGAAFYASCLKAGIEPAKLADLSRLRAVGSTGSPLPEEGYRWIWDHLPQREGTPVWLNPVSGGTDLAGAFIAGNPLLPVTVGERLIYEDRVAGRLKSVTQVRGQRTRARSVGKDDVHARCPRADACPLCRPRLPTIGSGEPASHPKAVPVR